MKGNRVLQIGYSEVWDSIFAKNWDKGRKLCQYTGDSHVRSAKALRSQPDGSKEEQEAWWAELGCRGDQKDPGVGGGNEGWDRGEHSYVRQWRRVGLYLEWDGRHWGRWGTAVWADLCCKRSLLWLLLWELTEKGHGQKQGEMSRRQMPSSAGRGCWFRLWWDSGKTGGKWLGLARWKTEKSYSQKSLFSFLLEMF